MVPKSIPLQDYRSEESNVGRTAVAPIAKRDIGRVGEFLHKNLNSRISAMGWSQAVLPPWPADSPNHGFMLQDDGAIVGVYLAFYSERTIAERNERFCNLAAWCVMPKYRLHGLKLLNALLGQPGYHFTDLSPSGNVIPLNERLGFRHLDTTTALMPNLPWPTLPGRHRVSSEPAVIESVLAGSQLKIYRDHRDARAAKHLVMIHRGERCYVIFRRDRRKALPLFASVLHVSNPSLFMRMAGVFGRHLLLRHGIPLTLSELRIVGGQPAGSFRLRSSRPKMFKSDSLRPEQIDNLYSELVCVAW
jgi:hypothetical protein